MLTITLILDESRVEHKGLLVYLVQNIYAHKGEGSSLPERPQDLSFTNSPRRIISGDVCGDSAEYA